MGAALLCDPRFAPGQLGVEQRRRARLMDTYQPPRDHEGLGNWYDAQLALRDERERNRAAEAALLEGMARWQPLQVPVVEAEPFQRGDHLQVWRAGYHHDGIYLWRGLVVQFGGGIMDKPAAVIECVPLATFAKNGEKVEAVVHPDQDREATIRRALQLLECPPGMPYDLFGHNCEHIARWCSTGRFDSEQVGLGLVLNTAVTGILVLEGEPAGALTALFSGLMILASVSCRGRFREHVEANGLG